MNLPTRVLSVAVPCFLIVSTVPAAWAAKANPAPRITAARMVDSDHDDRVDRVVLTWSEPITHPRDADKKYPLAITGYAITSVAAARRSRSLTVLVRERAARDISTHPAVRYVPTTKGAVKDNGGKQPARSVFARTVALDVDKDGYAATDCKPTVATIHPGALDKPDLGMLDLNCDGMDGVPNGPVFVRPGGSDSSEGSLAHPLETFDQAVVVADGTRDIYLAAGTYSSALTSPVTSSVYGGYSTSWTRSASNTSTLTLTNPLPLGGSPTLQQLRLEAPTSNTARGPVAVKAEDATARLEQVTIVSGAGAPASPGTPATSSVGLWSTDSTLQVVGGSITTGAGGDGASGTAGDVGALGTNGANGTDGECVLGAAVAPGGLGGSSPVLGHAGGAGGLGGTMLVVNGTTGTSSLDLTPGGAGGSTGTIGALGSPGTPGADGSAGAPGVVTDGVFGTLGFTPGTATDGAAGTTGKGGGGGGGGGGQLNGLQLGTGNGGGGGGGGGAPGSGGTAASGGGGSMAVWADTSTVTLTGTRIVTAGGGTGGSGGAGGIGGDGGNGGAGGSACPTRVGLGGKGGDGGTGGTGGAGGDGSGGPSVGVVSAGGSVISTPGVLWEVGPAGTSPAGAGHAGQRALVGTLAPPPG